MSRRGSCVSKVDNFCYICGSFASTKQRQRITDFVMRAYKAYFGMKLGDQDKPWAPHSVCRSCVENLRHWLQGKRQSLAFGIPMVWREPKDHASDCYFCLCNIKGYSKKNKRDIEYPNLPSAIRPMPHGPDVPVPVPPSSLDTRSSESDYGKEESDAQLSSSEGEFASKQPQLITQAELNNLVRELDLPKIKAELLGSRLKQKNLLAPGTSFAFYRHREQEFMLFFAKRESLVYCSDVESLIGKLGVPYDSKQWRLFIDSSRASLKAVLLHNNNILPSVPVAHSVQLTESYENLQQLLDKIQYVKHEWTICGDLKILSMLLGQQGGYTKFPCFLCEWDSRARGEHWTRREWPSRQELIVGSKNVIRKPLVSRDKILLPPLHIKLGLMKQFVKALDKKGACFQHITTVFPKVTSEKLTAGIFDGPQIRQLVRDNSFVLTMASVEKAAWESFVEVMENFLGNHKSDNYVEIVNNMLKNFEMLGCNMSVKVHFLHSHINYFPENLGQMSEEQGERFHQDMKTMELRYQGRWNESMLADYCWTIKSESSGEHTRKSRKRTFLQIAV